MSSILSRRRNEISNQDHLFNLQSEYLKAIKDAELDARRYSHWELSPSCVAALEKFGIVTIDRPHAGHAHPACKTIEEYIRVVVLPNLLKHQATTVLWSKENKCKEIANSINAEVTAINIAITAKDYTRYSSYQDEIPEIATEEAYIYDAAHYMEPADIYEIFARSPELITCFCTVVIPPELIDDLKSTAPCIYDYSKHDDGTFSFYPDGHVAGSYTQPLSGIWWFKHNAINGPEFTLTISKLDSYYAHHIYVITKRPCMLPTHIEFDFPDRVLLPNEVISYFALKYRTTNKDLFSATVNYALSVKVIQPEVMNARARQKANSLKCPTALADQLIAVQYATALNAAEWKFMPDALVITSPHHYITRMGPIRWMRIALNALHRAAWEDVLSNLDPPKYTARTPLTQYYLSSRSKHTTALTGTFSHINYRDLISLAVALLNGPYQALTNVTPPDVTGDNALLCGNASSSTSLPMPLFSAYAYTVVAERCFTSYLMARTLPHMPGLLLRSFRSLTRFYFRHPHVSYALAPTAVAVGLITCAIVPAVYSLTRSRLINSLHSLHLDNHMPKTVQVVYNNLKRCHLPHRLAQSDTPCITYNPKEIAVIVPDTPKRLTSALNTLLGDLQSNVPNPQPPPYIAATAPQLTHTLTSTNPSTLPQTSDAANPYTVCPTLFKHDTIEENVTCLLEMTEGDNACARCLAPTAPLSQTIPMRNGSNCLFTAVSQATGISIATLWLLYCHENTTLATAMVNNHNYGWSEPDITVLAFKTDHRITVFRKPEHGPTLAYGPISGLPITINYTPGHYSFSPPPAGNSEEKRNFMSQLKLSLDSKSMKTYAPNYKRAENFLKNIKNHAWGIVLPHEARFIKAAESCLMAPNKRRRVRLAVVMGTPGTGKTYPFTKLLASIPASADIYRMIFPTVQLRKETVCELNLPPGYGFKAPTPETPFTGSYAPIVIGDEAGKYPPGYFDLLIIMCPGIEVLILTGDPAQTIYNCTKPDNSLNSAQAEIDYFAPYAKCYLTTSRRFTAEYATQLGLPHIPNGNDGRIEITRRNVEAKINLVASDTVAKTMTELGRLTITFPGAQGGSYNHHYTIMPDKFSALADDRAWFTALTRGKRGLSVIVPSANIPHHRSAIARALFNQNWAQLRQAIQVHIAAHTPKHLLAPENMLAAHPCSVVDAKPSGNREPPAVNTTNLPHLSGILDETPEAFFFEPITETPLPVVPAIQDPTMRGLLDIKKYSPEAVENLHGLLCPIPSDPQSREVLYDGVMTQQIEENTLSHMMFLRHKRGDEATEKWTHYGRYVFGKNMTPLKDTAITGNILFTAFNQTFKPSYPTSFNTVDYELAAAQDQAKFVAKGFKVLSNIKGRADADWFDTHAELFTKGQTITKPGTFDRNAKMGQLVVSFNTFANFRFGALARYMTNVLNAALPDNIFFLDGKHDGDLSQFVLNKWDFTIDSTEDDYTAFDSTQGGEFLNFDAHLMRACQVPEVLIDDYLDFMCSLSTWMGKMGYMMPSGCKFTLKFNTTRSLAYQATKYKLPPKVPLCATGDDIACNAAPLERSSWRKVSKQLKLVSKRNTLRQPTFCGWVLTPCGVYKNPEILYQRTLYQKAKNNLSKAFFSYAADITPLKKNFEIISPYLTEEQCEMHFTTQQILHCEARRCGINLVRDFETPYGMKRHYDLQ
jgi:hypothetical protein